jgi:uncharacterized membrane protein YphA (DoxX/SURF4 family)
MYRWIGWAVVWLAALFFAQNGIQKISGTEQMVQMFHELGLADWLRIAVGVVEVAGAILLVIPRYTLAASVGMAAVMLGAVATELLNGRSFEVWIAGQWLAVFVLIGWIRYRIQRKSHAEGGAADV